MGLTWSVKVQLLLVFLMIYEALSQGNAMTCREELMRHRRGIIWRSLSQLSPTFTVAVPPCSCSAGLRRGQPGRGCHAGMQTNKQMLQHHDHSPRAGEVRTNGRAPDMDLQSSCIAHLASPTLFCSCWCQKHAYFLCSTALMLLVTLLPRTQSAHGCQWPIMLQAGMVPQHGRVQGWGQDQDSTSGINLSQNKLSLTYCEYRGKNISYSDWVLLMALIQYPPLRYCRGLKLAFLSKEQGFFYGSVPLYVIFKIPAFLSKWLVKKIRNIWLIKEPSFRTEIVPFQNITLIIGI